MNTDSLFHLLAILLTVSILLISATFRYRANKSGDPIDFQGEGRLILIIRRVIGLALWGSVLLYLVYPAALASFSLALPDAVRWLGAGVMALCVPLIYWVFSSLGKNVTPTVMTRKEHQLVTHGPYRWVRHPVYSSAYLFLFGFILLSSNWWIALVVILSFIPLALRTPIEEASLVERFGDEYREYIRRTGRFFPRFSR